MNDELQVIFLIISSCLVLFMQAGFAMLEVGSVRMKNAKSILFKNMASFCLSSVVWWMWGFGLAGTGASNQRGSGYVDNWRDGSQTQFLHSLSFACVTGTIVSGAITERMFFHSFLIFVIVVTGSIYPLIVRWCWGADGWLYRDFMYRDFAGSGVIHLCGGVCSGVGAYILGPRLHKFTESADGNVIINDIAGHSPTLSNLGVYILMLSWFFFNGSSVANVRDDVDTAARAMANTLVAGSAAGTVGLMINQLILGVHDLPAFHNAILSGFVGITGASGYVSGYSSVIIGIVSSIACILASHVMLVLQIDDVVDAFAVHGGGGIVGLIGVGLLAERAWLDVGTEDCGLFVGGDGSLLFGQIIGAVAISAYSAAVTAVTLLILKYWPTGNQLRVPKDVELLGLDFMYHEGSAWPEFNPEKLNEAQNYKEAERRAAETGKIRKRRNVSNLTPLPTSSVESNGLMSRSETDDTKQAIDNYMPSSSMSLGNFKLVPATRRPVMSTAQDDDDNLTDTVDTSVHKPRSNRSASIESSDLVNTSGSTFRQIIVSPQTSTDNQGEDINDLFDTVIKEPKLVIRNGKLMKI